MLRCSDIRMGALRCCLASLLLATPVMCGPSRNPACEAAAGPFTVTVDQSAYAPVSFEARFGTAVLDRCLNPFQPPPQVLDGSWMQLNILLTPDADACPPTWYLPDSRPADHEVRVLWLAIAGPTGVPLLGTFALCCQRDGDDFTLGDLTEGLMAPAVTPAVVAAYRLPKGLHVPYAGSQLADIVYGNGTLAINRYVAGQDVAGTFAVTFADGASLAGSFDVPFCTILDPSADPVAATQAGTACYP